MQYRQIVIHSLLNKITTKDNLFGGVYTVDPYQNCELGCSYCDSTIDKTIYIKTNAVEILRKELEKISKGVIIVGSVHDPYQNAEKNFKITRKILEIIKNNNFSCHILTKSDMVLRDIDILTKIDNNTVTLSLVSIQNSIAKIFEPNAPSPKKRLQTIEELTNKGINAGLAIMPILPFIVDNEFEEIVKSAKEHKANYILHKHLELKGDQKQLFFELLKNFKPNLLNKYKKLYQSSYKPDKKYISKINHKLDELCKKNKIKKKI